MSEDMKSISAKVRARPQIVNEFCITFSTINGSGSATANSILLRTLFRMGIPVSGKNIFPSNIQGLPTWYSLRLSKKGYIARIEKDDIVVAMNPTTIAKEIEYLVEGGVLFYADDIKLPPLREDVIAYPMPVKKLVKDSEVSPNLREYIANMVYVGALAFILGIGLDEIYKTLDFQFKGKKKAIDSNFNVIKAAVDWASNNLEKKDVYKVEPMNNTEGYIITPASSLAESMMEYVPQLRRDPMTGKSTCVIVQAEDELAAAGMVVGAGWAGLRAMSSTSGPGISLMSEYLGLAYYAECPLVIWDVQRVGPSTGLPTRTAQGDITQIFFNSHGDTNFIVLFPGSVHECFEDGWRAFDLAERLQTPVIVMTDLDLGMNQWMTPKFKYPDIPMDRGKLLWEKDLEQILSKRNGDYGRYLDIDGDGIPYRTVMGNTDSRGAYFTRGTGHDEYGRYSEDAEVWENGLNRLARKFETAKNLVPRPIFETIEGSEIGIIAYGSTDPAVIEARDILQAKGVKTDYLRIRALPFSDTVKDFIQNHERSYVVELNRDGQMKQLLTLEVPELATRLRGLAHIDGLPMTASWIVTHLLEQEGN
jgi:2-oxoglutarate ferredoxin oxidoreductase subunit alpha